MAELQLSLPAFVPKLAFRLLHDTPFPPRDSCRQDFDVSVLLADVSGFSGIVETLSARLGSRGAEKLQEVLNDCFVPLTELVDAAGGEVLSFPGDSALAVWMASPEDGAEALEDLVCQSAACALDLRAKLDRLKVSGGLELRLRVAIGAGRACGALVGGNDGQWEAVLLGGAVAQLHEALEVAKPGEVVFSPQASAIAGRRFTGRPRASHLVVDGSIETAARRLPPRRQTVPVPPEMVRMLISPSVLGRIEAGHGAWLGEFRNATVMFLQLSDTIGDDQETLQRSVETIQRTVRKFGGAVNQIVADDKGLTVVTAFGIAQRAHEDDPSRAARVSLLLQTEFRDLGVKVQIGIATGHVFTGGRGGASRQELALLGGSVILAARLASLADDILCDSATRAASRRHVRFESSSPVTIKGRPERIEVWRPVATRTDAERGGASIIGRQGERAVLLQRLSALEREGHGGLVIVQGEPGIGKTALVNEFLKLAQSHAVRSLTGAADSIEQRTAYLAWRPVAAGILGLDAAHDSATQRKRALELLGAENDRWLPLLNVVIPGAPAESELTLRMDADSRARATRDLLITMLEAAARVTPLVIVLEDAHWMDSASWELVEQAGARVSRALFVITTRSSPSNVEALVRTIASSRATLLRLDTLSADEIRELVCRRLDADAVPLDVVAMINRRAEGHPLFAEELASALRSRGALVVTEGICRLSTTRERDDLVPGTVHGIVATRIDQLSPQCQMTLKVAAVLGREFTLADLSEVHPLDSRDPIERQVDEIVRAGLLRSSPEAGAFSFSHAIVQEVAYDLLAFTQRAELHRRTAERLERAEGEHLDDRAALLAHHWERANAVEKAMHYLEQAGERALLKDSSYGDAADFLTRLITLADADHEWGRLEATDVPMIGRLNKRTIMLARWERMLSQALLRVGQHAAALQHVERSITLFGLTMPSPSIRCHLELLAGLAIRLVTRPTGARRHQVSGLARLALLEVSLAHENLSRQMYLGHVGGRPLVRGALSLLRSVKASELAGPSAELTKAYCAFSTLMSPLGAYKRSTQYTGIGESTAVEIGDSHALVRALTTGCLSVYQRGGNWTYVRAQLEKAVALGTDLRLVHDGLISETLLAYVYLNEGRLDDALRRFKSIQSRAAADHAVPFLWAATAVADATLRQGRITDAIDAAQDALEIADKANSLDQKSRFQAHGILASAWLRTEGVQRARRHLDLAIAAGDKGGRMSYTAQFGFAGVAEVLLALSASGKPESQEAARHLRHWLRQWRLIALMWPIYRPWYLLLRARWHAQSGRRRLAAQRLRRAVWHADRMQLPYEAAVTRAELARLMNPGNPARETLIDDACLIFSTIGAEAARRETQTLK